MIPIRLTLRNFLCYRENVPTLDFTGLHVACLCGPNGHGKSALLDAITWCLWGKARGKNQDDLISYGAEESRVELEFLARDTQYRVIRSRARGGGRRRQGVTDLQLQVLHEDNSQPITGNTVRETEAKIDQLLGMDFDTFINSAFLLQGRADEFTSKAPADRKEILAKILGLDIYDRLQDRAKERLENKKIDADKVQGALDQMNRQVEEIGIPDEELAEVNRHVAKLDRQLNEKRLHLDVIHGQVYELRKQRDELTALQGQTPSLLQDITHLESGIATSEVCIEKYKGIIQQADAIRYGVSQLQEARHSYEILERSRRRFDEINGKRNRLAQMIATQRGRLEAQVEQLKQKIEVGLVPKAQLELGLVSQLEKARQKLVVVEDDQSVFKQRRHLQELVSHIGETQTAAGRFQSEGEELRAKLDLLVGASHGAVCPLCGTSLKSDGCERLAETYSADIDEKRRNYRENQVRLRQLESQKKTLERKLIDQEKAFFHAQKEGHALLQNLERQIHESQQARIELDEAKILLASSIASLASGDFAGDDQAQLKDIEAEIVALDYDDAAPLQCYGRMQELLHYEEQQHHLSQAEGSLPGEEESLVRIRDMFRRRQEEAAELQKRHRAAEDAIAGLPQREAALLENEVTLVALESGQREMVARSGFLGGQVNRLKELRQQINDRSATFEALQGECGIYRDLVNALGRQGVQAMLIETIVPRLEEEANILLGRMTDNRMHLKLETQIERRTTRGQPTETLQINVSDELGLRSYEMYSGGEAFRVDLALRVALSKVLSQRQGVPLSTLFIDEGFGTQDAAGRERILDVINTIEKDFDKIIVITHLDDLKDMFPDRIEVRKERDGSTFWLS
jgi:exonuclease SbcC